MYCHVLIKFEPKAPRMKTKILILLALPFLFFGCKKDTYTTKPQISVKSINNKQLKPGDLLIFQIGFTDAEGDIQDTLWVQKISRVCPGSAGAQFLSKNRIPDFTPIPNLKGVLEIGYSYGVSGEFQTINGCPNRNDTCYFKFWMKDKANNRSDTITTENIVLLK
jgi:hypothetical protein